MARTGLGGVVVEALDPPALAGFWARALEWEQLPATGAGTMDSAVEAVDAADIVGAVAGAVVLRSPRPGRIGLAFVPSDRPRTVKNRLHLDLAGGAAEIARLSALGAVPCDIGQGAVPWEVLADPEGNEFCVLPHVEADDHLAAIAQDAADTEQQIRFWQPATGWVEVARGDWGVRLRDPSGEGPTLVMGPPAAPRRERNRLRLALTGLDASGGGGVDPEGNAFERWEPFSGGLSRP
ncbi:VOC family protein [Streptacidiphilus rugosus]|uniref:VOC family protein n=1 Tax=Streptacidiphilus rugosus TaxID=405783 RepID=UPI0006905129|nr:VOC family protein [Streptacidiphilus rugosus]